MKRKAKEMPLVNETIPCEVCEEEISLKDWEAHIKNCLELDDRQIEALRQRIENQQNDALMPCEYCSQLVVVHDLEQHTRTCAEEYADPRQQTQTNGVVLIPCEYCLVQVNLQELIRHTDECAKRTTEANAKATGLGPSEASNDLIPCEYCDQFYPLQSIESHQTMCGQPIMSADHSPNARDSQERTSGFSLPKHWDPSVLPNLSRHTLSTSADEYKFVAEKFRETLPKNKIVRIERIQNRRWYRQYDAHKDDFIERYGTSTERWLFHGCRQHKSVQEIIDDCFNRSHATNCAYGQGIYFATQASISHSYTQPDSRKHRYMFLACVLVGRTAMGNSSTRVCPPGFDTTGGDDIYVTYHDAQAYGEYLIVYK